MISRLSSQLSNVQQCLGQVSMRLTHKKTGDVVWFAKSSIDSASFHREPLIYSFEQQQMIKNELEVASFVMSKTLNKLVWRELTKTLTIPAYQTISRMTRSNERTRPV